ncbi:MAG TPA: L,D-transpeptidase [Baekduia sp.]|nr:L,D-transpeptidase [Baekduia sp.]
MSRASAIPPARLAVALAVAAVLSGLCSNPAAAQDPSTEPPNLVDSPVLGPSRANGSTTARIITPTFARKRLRSKRYGRVIGVQTSWSGQPQTLLVLDSAMRGDRQWLKLLLPVRPNGSTGWVMRDRVVLSRTRYWIDVDVSARLVRVFHRGKRVRRFGAVVGAPGTPTPVGLAAIYERNRQPNPAGFLGPWALPLTILSNVLENYGGGPGRVAIHGRAGASLSDPLGSARSHGCIRVENRHIEWLAAGPPAGTPVRIRR